ncbi:MULTISPECIES: GntR family transcriptional regulator [Paenibacillus]|uniref:Transcriptional regulator n=1 Tax=Paenibacillus naphthalenovorans TaxID=162209 RepID=A0A0U2WDB7_9BACL|nr:MULTISPECIES: GntR family transcriptional regulator [Paenibacillus]ALS23338.1 transcriptional regulator [Paenibacillus naphthalenovorans]SDI08324.1 GntR family transcriptional regulator [Paenibacillus naphthalenovorans]
MAHEYIRIKEELERQMESGELVAGEKLPSEPEMARRFGVSRETFRSAVKQLEREGKLRVSKGIGRFVTRPQDSIPSSLDRLSSTSEMIRSSGLGEGEYQESIRTVPCEPEWAGFLHIESGDPVVVSERIRTAGGEPVSFNINILPYAISGEAFKRRRLHGSLMRFLEEECGIRIVSANTELIVPAPSDVHAAKLRLTEETPVLLLKQTHYDEDFLPVLFSYDYFRNDVFKFWIKRTR